MKNFCRGVGILAIVAVNFPVREAAAFEQAADARKDETRILLVTQALEYQHDTAKRKGDAPSFVEQTVTELGRSSGLFRVECTQDVAKDFTREKLDRSDIVMFYTTGELPIQKEVLDYFLNDWLKQAGRGFLGVHCATDTLKKHRPYWEMIGGTFDGHGVWGHAGPPFTVAVHEPEHPACKPWGKEFEIDDEIYVFRNWQPEKVRVLMSVNMAKTDKKMPRHMPIAWCRDYGKGRVFYLTLGHEPRTWADPRHKDSLLGAIRWLRGLEQGNSAPNPDLSTQEEAKAKAAFEATK